MFDLQMPRHGRRALASDRDSSFHKAAQALLGAVALVAISVLLCAAGAQTAHFSWTQTTLADSLGYPDGVAVDSSGNVYVVEMAGGPVQEIVAVNGVIPPSPTINPLGGSIDEPMGIAVDAGGNVYVADYASGAVEEIVAVNGGIPATPTIRTWTWFAAPRGLAVDTSGDVYVAVSGAGLVQKFVAVNGVIPDSPTVKTVESFNYPCAVALDGSGNVYVSDPSTGWVYELFAVDGSIPLNPAVSFLAKFDGPVAISVDGGGNVYVADAVDNALYELPAGASTPFRLGTGFNVPEGVAVGSNGRIFVADFYGERVVEVMQSAGNFGAFNVGDTSGKMTVGFTFDSAGEITAPAVVTQGAAGLDFADAGTGSCTTNGLSHTYAVGEVCTMDVIFTPSKWGPRYGAVELRDGAGAMMAIGYVYGTGVAPQATFALPNQSAVGSALGNPTGLATDGSGDLFVADIGKGVTTEIEPSGTIVPLPSVSGFYALAMDGGGNLFVAKDTGTPAIFEYFSVGNYTSFRQLAGAQTFDYITGLAVDGNGNLFVADYYGGAVYEITAASGYNTVKTLPTGSTTPYGIAVDVNGNVFYSDDHNDSVSEIPAPGYSSVKVLNSTFNIPWGIALDGNGNIFVADYENNALKEIMASGGYKTVNTLAANAIGIQAVALDPGGKVYYSVNGGASVTRLDYTAWPDLDFPATALGSTSSTQTVTINNTGNQWLALLAIGYPEHFPETLPAIDECYTGGYVPAGGSCSVTVAFAPRALGPLSGAVMLVDNSLYPEWDAYQKIDVFGKGLHTQAIAFTDSLPSSANYSAGLSYTLSANGGGSGNPVVFSLVSGPATLVGSKLTITGAGTVVVAADQAGNSTYAAAPEVTQSITIKLASQTITFPPITGTHYAGTQLTLSATASSGLAVTFSSGTTSICSVAGSTLSLLIQGTCIVHAAQAGNASWAAATTVIQSFAVLLAPQTITFTPLTGTHYATAQVPLSATATSGLTVTFSSTTSSICSVSGSTLSLLIPGTCIVHAAQAGNTVYAAASTQVQSFAVTLAPQTISFTPITGKQYATTQVPLSATASSGLAVTFSSTTTSICSVAGSTLSLLTPGTCIVHASQAGNSVYAAATTAQSFAVSLDPQTINFTPITGSQYAATQVTLSATASSGLTVTFSSTTTSICSVSSNTLSLLTAGTCVVHASQAGNSIYASATTAQSFAVKAAH